MTNAASRREPTVPILPRCHCLAQASVPMVAARIRSGASTSM
jgi:hypothetical protein